MIIFLIELFLATCRLSGVSHWTLSAKVRFKSSPLAVFFTYFAFFLHAPFLHQLFIHFPSQRWHRYQKHEYNFRCFCVAQSWAFLWNFLLVALILCEDFHSQHIVNFDYHWCLLLRACHIYIRTDQVLFKRVWSTVGENDNFRPDSFNFQLVPFHTLFAFTITLPWCCLIWSSYSPMPNAGCKRRCQAVWWPWGVMCTFQTAVRCKFALSPTKCFFGIQILLILNWAIWLFDIEEFIRSCIKRLHMPVLARSDVCFWMSLGLWDVVARRLSN